MYMIIYLFDVCAILAQSTSVMHGQTHATTAYTELFYLLTDLT